jgi:hypothetical protein
MYAARIRTARPNAGHSTDRPLEARTACATRHAIRNRCSDRASEPVDRQDRSLLVTAANLERKMKMKGIMVTWGTPFAGRERLALEEFASYTQWVTTLKTQGKISRYEHYMPLYGKFESFAGFSIIEGSEQQIDAISDSEDFRTRVQRVITVAHGVRVMELDVGDDVGKRMKQYGSAIQQLKL